MLLDQPCPKSADTVEKVFWGWRTKFSRAADAFRAQRCERTTSFLRKTTTDFRIGAMQHPSGGLVQKSTFARFLEFFDFRLFQQYLPEAEVVPSYSINSSAATRRATRSTPTSSSR